jgi:hypothetical protein
MADLPPTPDLVTVTSPKGVKFRVAAPYAPQFQGLVTDLENSGYPLNQGTSGGYNDRYIAGTTTPSEHAFGRAIDVNSDQNPQGADAKYSIPPDLARSLATKYGLTWGGDWSGNTRDPMHFQAASVTPPAPPPPQSDIDRFLTKPAAAATLTPSTPPPPTTTATSPSDMDRFLAAPPPSMPPVAPVPAPQQAPPAASSGAPLPTTTPATSTAATAPPATTTAAPAPSSQPALTVTGSWVPPVVTNTVAGINRGLTGVQGVADAADAWLGRNVPGYQTVENALTQNTGGAVIPGAQASAQDQQRAAALDAQYGGGTAYWLGKLGGELVGTAPLAGPLGQIGGRIGGWLLGRFGTAIGTGAGSGAGFNVGVGGSQEDPNSNALVNLGTGAAGGAAAGGLGGALAAGASKLFGGVGSAVESMAERLGIPLSRGEKTGGVALSLEDASSGLPFSGAAKLAQQKNAAFAKIAANEMGIPGPVQNITTPMLNQAEARIGQGIETVAPKLDAPMDQGFLNDVTRIQQQAALQGGATPHANAAINIGDQLFNTAAANNGTIPGTELARFLKRGGDLDSLVNSSNPDVANVGRQMKDSLMAAAERGSASPDDLAELQQLRQQWKAVQTARPVIDRTVAGSEEMSPQRLATQIMNNYDMRYTGPGNEMQDMARVINATKPLPSSGTAERLQRQRLWTAGLGGGAAAGTGAALYAYDPNAAADASTALGTAAALATAGRFSRLGMPGSAYVPRLLGGDIGTWMQNQLQQPRQPQNQLMLPPP